LAWRAVRVEAEPSRCLSSLRRAGESSGVRQIVLGVSGDLGALSQFGDRRNARRITASKPRDVWMPHNPVVGARAATRPSRRCCG
jgi:hypothetical protein